MELKIEQLEHIIEEQKNHDEIIADKSIMDLIHSQEE